MALAYERPAEYFSVPPRERRRRVRCNADLCSIDDQVFVIRGVLELPIKDSDEHFEFGVWAIVDERDFKRYLDLWDADNAGVEPPFEGRLSGGVGFYADSDMLPVSVQMRSGNKRPIFRVLSDHPLGEDQRAGITFERVHAFLEQAGMLPSAGSRRQTPDADG